MPQIHGYIIIHILIYYNRDPSFFFGPYNAHLSRCGQAQASARGCAVAGLAARARGARQLAAAAACLDQIAPARFARPESSCDRIGVIW